MDQVEAPAEQAHQVPESIDVLQIMQAIPHRYPFLLIDKMQEIKAGESALGVKNVTFN